MLTAFVRLARRRRKILNRVEKREQEYTSRQRGCVSSLGALRTGAADLPEPAGLRQQPSCDSHAAGIDTTPQFPVPKSRKLIKGVRVFRK